MSTKSKYHGDEGEQAVRRGAAEMMRHHRSKACANLTSDYSKGWRDGYRTAAEIMTKILRRHAREREAERE